MRFRRCRAIAAGMLVLIVPSLGAQTLGIDAGLSRVPRAETPNLATGATLEVPVGRWVRGSAPAWAERVVLSAVALRWAQADARQQVLKSETPLVAGEADGQFAVGLLAGARLLGQAGHGAQLTAGVGPIWEEYLVFPGDGTFSNRARAQLAGYATLGATFGRAMPYVRLETWSDTWHTRAGLALRLF